MAIILIRLSFAYRRIRRADQHGATQCLVFLPMFYDDDDDDDDDDENGRRRRRRKSSRRIERDVDLRLQRRVPPQELVLYGLRRLLPDR